MKINKKLSIATLLIPVLLSGCASSGIQMGGNDPTNVITGSAGGSQASGKNSALEH